MEAISTTVPSINVPKLHPQTTHFHHLKPPLLHPHHHRHTTTSTTTKPPTSITTKPTLPFTPHHLPPTSHPPPIHTHRNAATGYAAALIDAAISNTSLEAIHKDVKKLLKWLQCNEMVKGLMGDELVDENVKGKVIKDLCEKSKLRRHVVAMVKMLVAKKKCGMVVQVMEEFERIYYELNRGLSVVG